MSFQVRGLSRSTAVPPESVEIRMGTYRLLPRRKFDVNQEADVEWFKAFPCTSASLL